MATREGYTELQARVLAARRVWKRTLFWTGCAIAIVGLIAILAGAAIVDLLMPLPSSVRIVLLIGIIGTVVYLLYRYLIQPLRVKLTPHDVALNVERKHQDLEDRLVSALQFGEVETEDPIQSHLLQRLVTDAVERTEEIDFRATVDKSKKRKHVGIAVAALAVCALIGLIFPTELDTSLNRLLSPWEKTEPVFTTKLTVEPGNARILRGRSLAINLEVTGKAADKARLVYTKEDTTTDTEPQRQEIDMVRIEGEKRKFGYELFNINENVEYYVTANGTESERYTVEVFDMPKVTAIEIAYTYPEYTKLKPIIQQGEGNIRAVTGSQAEVRITTNKAIQSATLTVDAKDPIPMLISDGRTLTTALDVLNDGKYTVKLLCVDGFNNQAPIEYTITAISDEPPEIVIKEPGRDIKATKLEEVRVLAEATDDYGVENVTLMYSIGSGDAQELPVETVEVKAEKIISGAYVFYLEELDVEPGELISYYAQATDNNTRTGPGTSTSELYFIEVRPFNERYMQMDAEGQQAAEGQPFPNLIADQRTIIKKTWKHIHSRPSAMTEDYQSAVKQIGKEQNQLKDKTQRVTDELSMSMRDANVDPEMLMNLEGAVGKMGDASDELFAIKPKEALPHEQDALELLTKAMMELDKVLTQMRSSGSQAAADNIEMDMEDLQDSIEQDENELDEQMREQTQELLDQVRDMLTQQEQLTEQSQQLAREGQPSRREMQQNSQQEQQLAGQAQQMAEQAQQMGQSVGQGAGNNTGQRMVQAGESLEQASENMQSASESMGAGQPQMGAAKGQKAEENLQQAIEELEKVAAQYTDQALEDVTEAMDQLLTKQSEIQKQTETLEEETRRDGISVEDLRNASQLANEQRTLRRDLEQLQRNLSNLREALNENEPQAARNVADANRRIIEEQASENMEDAQRALQWRNFQSSEREQREVLDTLLEARDDLQQARTNLAETEEERLDAALDQIESWEAQMQDIQRELEAMDNQETPLTPEQEARQEQLSEQQAEIQQRAQEAMEAQQQGDAQGDEQAQQVGGAESDRELRELWLDAIRAMDNRPGTRRAPFPRYDFSLRELRKLERAIEERLVVIQEKKQLAQVLKEDVPPEYRRLVDQYYESLAK